MKKLINLSKEGKINENAGITDKHSIIINAHVAKVWEILTHIEDWDKWNPEISDIEINNTENKDVINFKWSFDDIHYHSQVQKINKNELFSFVNKSRYIKGITTWEIEDQDNLQTIVTLSVSIQGMFMLLSINHQKLYREVLNWLKYLKKKCEE